MPSVPQEINPLGKSIVREYIHLITFALLGFLVEFGRDKRSMCFWLGMLALYSISSEVLQGILNPICHRTFALSDIVQDISGVLLGTLIGHYCRPLVKRPSGNS